MQYGKKCVSMGKCKENQQCYFFSSSFIQFFHQTQANDKEMTDTRRDSTSGSSTRDEKTTADKSKATTPPFQPIAPSSTKTTQASSPSKATASPRSVVPPTKRRKVSIACHECRTHKTKCDGAQPICGSCRKKKLPEDACAYSPERGRRGVKNQ